MCLQVNQPSLLSHLHWFHCPQLHPPGCSHWSSQLRWTCKNASQMHVMSWLAHTNTVSTIDTTHLASSQVLEQGIKIIHGELGSSIWGLHNQKLVLIVPRDWFGECQMIDGWLQWCINITGPLSGTRTTLLALALWAGLELSLESALLGSALAGSESVSQ